MSVVTTNVKVTDLESKEADEVEVETDVWEETGRSATADAYIRLLANKPLLSGLVVGRSLNTRNCVPEECSLMDNNACLCSRPD